MIAQGTFREDLFYRLNVIQIAVPPLRNRREDIPLLVEQFLTRFREANDSEITGLSPDAMKALHEYSWPGNVRELENVIERLVVTMNRRTVELEDLPAASIRCSWTGTSRGPTSAKSSAAASKKRVATIGLWPVSSIWSRRITSDS
jgi:transcriptional regulator with PAS, ATPase and Fis domain